MTPKQVVALAVVLTVIAYHAFAHRPHQAQGDEADAHTRTPAHTHSPHPKGSDSARWTYSPHHFGVPTREHHAHEGPDVTDAPPTEHAHPEVMHASEGRYAQRGGRSGSVGKQQQRQQVQQQPRPREVSPPAGASRLGRMGDMAAQPLRAMRRAADPLLDLMPTPVPHFLRHTLPRTAESWLPSLFGPASVDPFTGWPSAWDSDYFDHAFDSLRQVQPPAPFQFHVHDDPDRYEVEAHVPGWKREQLRVELQGDQLVLAGERRTDGTPQQRGATGSGKQQHYQHVSEKQAPGVHEYTYFRKSYALPSELLPHSDTLGGRLSATFDPNEHVLRVDVPKPTHSAEQIGRQTNQQQPSQHQPQPQPQPQQLHLNIPIRFTSQREREQLMADSNSQ